MTRTQDAVTPSWQNTAPPLLEHSNGAPDIVPGPWLEAAPREGASSFPVTTVQVSSPPLLQKVKQLSTAFPDAIRHPTSRLLCAVGFLLRAVGLPSPTVAEISFLSSVMGLQISAFSDLTWLPSGLLLPPSCEEENDFLPVKVQLTLLLVVCPVVTLIHPPGLQIRSVRQNVVGAQFHA